MFKERYMVSLDNTNRVEVQLYLIDYLYRELDFLASPDIEERVVCSFDCSFHCCIWSHAPHNGPRYIREFLSALLEDLIEEDLESYVDDSQSIIGEMELKALQELDVILYDALYEAGTFGDEGFSKTQQWLDFVDRISKINIFLKDILGKHGRAVD